MLGTNPWTSREQYLSEKREGVQLTPTQPMLHGSFDEKHNMKKFTWITGVRTRSTNLFMASKRWTCLASTIDGLAVPPVRHNGFVSERTKGDWPDHLVQQLSWEDPNVPGLIEMKQTEVWTGRKLWLNSDAPPEHYQLQLQTQLHVTGLSWGILCARVGAYGMKAFFIRRDDSEDFVQNMNVIVEDFRKEMGL